MGEELRGIVGERVGRSPGICLDVAVGVAEEQVVIALGGCCSPLSLDSKALFSFLSFSHHGVCMVVCAQVCAPGCAWWSGEVGFQRSSTTLGQANSQWPHREPKALISCQLCCSRSG